MKMTPELFQRVEGRVVTDAEQKRLNAAYGGEPGDGGADRMLRDLSFYTMGQQGTIPQDWKKFAIEEANPEEFQQYLKLKKKFEGQND